MFEKDVRQTVSDMKTLTMRALNRRTASVLNALERGETFELHRNGKVVGYLTHTAPPPERKADWKAHFDWLRQQPTGRSEALLAEFEADRRRGRNREQSLGNQP